MPLPIVHYNDPILRRKGEKVTLFDPALAHLADQLIATMHAAEGIGLAAQQVGRPLQVCVVDLLHAEAQYAWEFDGAKPPRELFMPLVLVNPKVAAAPGTPQVVMEEGCLSFPQIRGDVSRPDEITVEFSDERGNKHRATCIACWRAWTMAPPRRSTPTTLPSWFAPLKFACLPAGP